MGYKQTKKPMILTIAMIMIFFTFCIGESAGSTEVGSISSENLTQLSVSSETINKIYGINFGPYMDGQNPNFGSQVDREQVVERLTIIAPYTIWIRTYGTENGLEYIGPAAHEMELKTAIGAWLSGDTEANDRQINELINESKNGYVDLAIVGSETLLRNDLSEDQLIEYIKRVKQAVPGINVTTADTYSELLNHPKVMAECDVIMYNSYPYWEGINIDNAIEMQDNVYKSITDQIKNKPIIVSETGWPSAGNTIGNAVPSSENSARYFNDFVSWARKNNIQYFYFEAFDEPWKANYEGPQGAYWGIWDKDGNMKPGMETILLGEEFTSKKPIADFSSSVTIGYAPLSALFTDLSQNVVSRSWDIGNDGTVESTDANFSYEFTSEGTYEVNLTVRNANDTASKIASIIVFAESRSSSGSSSGSGGTGGGSPEPAKNVKVKELSQAFIANGKAVQFNFTKNATCVIYVSFDSKKNASKITTIVEELKNKSVLVSEMPEGDVHKYFNVWVGDSGFATSENIENPVLSFRVGKDWILDENIDQDSINLNIYEDETWVQLPVNISGKDNEFLYFTSEVPGFSSFAITGKAKSTDEETETGAYVGSDARVVNETNERYKEYETEQETTSKESVNAPGFAVIYGLAGLLAVFLYRRK